MGALLSFGVVMILLRPLAEIDLTPTREYRTTLNSENRDKSLPLSVVMSSDEEVGEQNKDMIQVYVALYTLGW
jgi:hypothetical protein